MEREEAFVLGKGMYVDDISFPNMLYMGVVRSTYAMAKLLSVKGDGIIDGKELKAMRASVGEGATAASSSSIMEPILASDKVYYVGQPIAAVFAESRYEAEDKISSVEADYEPMQSCVSIESALAGKPIHEGTKSNIIKEAVLGSQSEEPNADVIVEDKLFNARIMPNPIEPRGIIADYDGERLTVYISTQSVHSIKRGLSSSLNMDPGKIRVIQADTGGAFGSKGGLYPEYVIAAYAAMKFKRPVKWIETRREHLLATNAGRGVKGRMKLFADKSGKILALRGEVTVDAGAFGGGMSEFTAQYIAMQITGPYKIENARIVARSVMTNKPVQGPYRGAGRPEAAFMMERMMDMLADKLKMDPAKLRLLNMSDKPFTSPLGLKIEAALPFFQKALIELDYERLKSSNAGMGFFVLVPAFAPGETARIRIDKGKVDVWLGGNAHGQGHEVFVKKLINEELGIPEELVTLNKGDTDMLQSGIGSWGSRSAIAGGAAVVSAARKIRKEYEDKHGKFSTTELLNGAYDSFVFEKQEGQLNSFGANIATVSIDKYGVAKVKDCIAYYDLGRALSPPMVRGQIIGGMAQGIGQTLYEEVVHSDDGQLLTSSISDAGVPIAENMPEFVVKIAENGSPLPHGAKGLGEAPTIGVPLALCRAIELVSGKRINSTPVKQEFLAQA